MIYNSSSIKDLTHAIRQLKPNNMQSQNEEIQEYQMPYFKITNLRKQTVIGWKPQVILGVAIFSQKTHLKYATE